MDLTKEPPLPQGSLAAPQDLLLQQNWLLPVPCPPQPSLQASSLPSGDEMPVSKLRELRTSLQNPQT